MNKLIALASLPLALITLLSNALASRAQPTLQSGCQPGYTYDFSSQRCIRKGSTQGGTVVTRIGWRRPGSIIPNPDQVLARVEDLISRGQASANDYLRAGQAYIQLGNSSMAETRYRQGLELAQQTEDTEGQAIALEGLGNVFAATGREQEAVSHLTQARSLYSNLGYQQIAGELDLQLFRLSTSGTLTSPSTLQIAPGLLNNSPLEVAPGVLNNPSLQTVPSQLQIQQRQ